MKNKLTIIFAALLVLGVSAAVGVVGAYHYKQVESIVQERQDKRNAEIRAKIEAREAQEAAEKQAKIQKMNAQNAEKKDKVQSGTAENKAQTLRGLTANMLQTQMAGGVIRFYYEIPSEDGIFIQPSVTTGPEGVNLFVTVTHNGARSENFIGVEVQSMRKQIYTVKAASSVRITGREGGIRESFIQLADPEAETALRTIASDLSGNILMADMPSGSESDRAFTSDEAMRIRDMLHLYDILSGSQKTAKLKVLQ